MGKPKLKICKECGQSKRLKAFPSWPSVCKDCSSQARHPDRGVKESFIRPAVIEAGVAQDSRRIELLSNPGVFEEYTSKGSRRAKVVYPDQAPSAPLYATVTREVWQPSHEEQLCRELWTLAGRTPRDPNDNTIHEHNRYTSELFPDSNGYIADHVSSQVGRLITRPTIGPIYQASKGPYDTRFLAKVHHRYLGNGKHLSTQILGQMVASQHGGEGVGEPIANDKYGTVINVSTIWPSPGTSKTPSARKHG